MDDRLDMRASDAERQDVVERLRAALGRWPAEDGRVRRADGPGLRGGDPRRPRPALPGPARDTTHPSPARPPAPPPAPVPTPAPVPAPATYHRGVFARQPAALKVLWTIWLVAVSVNVVVWVLVSGTTAHLMYPWPLWVAGPYGAALLAISVAAPSSAGAAGQRVRPPLPPGQS